MIGNVSFWKFLDVVDDGETDGPHLKICYWIIRIQNKLHIKILLGFRWKAENSTGVWLQSWQN